MYNDPYVGRSLGDLRAMISDLDPISTRFLHTINQLGLIFPTIKKSADEVGLLTGRRPDVMKIRRLLIIERLPNCRCDAGISLAKTAVRKIEVAFDLYYKKKHMADNDVRPMM